jgi:hypothetical protein
VVCVLEAMKMQNIIRAERDGAVKAVNAKAGDRSPPTRCWLSSPDARLFVQVVVA